MQGMQYGNNPMQTYMNSPEYMRWMQQAARTQQQTAAGANVGSGVLGGAGQGMQWQANSGGGWNRVPNAGVSSPAPEQEYTYPDMGGGQPGQINVQRPGTQPFRGAQGAMSNSGSQLGNIRFADRPAGGSLPQLAGGGQTGGVRPSTPGGGYQSPAYEPPNFGGGRTGGVRGSFQPPMGGGPTGGIRGSFQPPTMPGVGMGGSPRGNPGGPFNSMPQLPEYATGNGLVGFGRGATYLGSPQSTPGAAPGGGDGGVGNWGPGRMGTPNNENAGALPDGVSIINGQRVATPMVDPPTSTRSWTTTVGPDGRMNEQMNPPAGLPSAMPGGGYQGGGGPTGGVRGSFGTGGPMVGAMPPNAGGGGTGNFGPGRMGDPPTTTRSWTTTVGPDGRMNEQTNQFPGMPPTMPGGGYQGGGGTGNFGPGRGGAPGVPVSGGIQYTNGIPHYGGDVAQPQTGGGDYAQPPTIRGVGNFGPTQMGGGPTGGIRPSGLQTGGGDYAQGMMTQNSPLGGAGQTGGFQGPAATPQATSGTSPVLNQPPRMGGPPVAPWVRAQQPAGPPPRPVMPEALPTPNGMVGGGALEAMGSPRANSALIDHMIRNGISGSVLQGITTPQANPQTQRQMEDLAVRRRAVANLPPEQRQTELASIQQAAEQLQSPELRNEDGTPTELGALVSDRNDSISQASQQQRQAFEQRQRDIEAARLAQQQWDQQYGQTPQTTANPGGGGGVVSPPVPPPVGGGGGTGTGGEGTGTGGGGTIPTFGIPEIPAAPELNPITFGDPANLPTVDPNGNFGGMPGGETPGSFSSPVITQQQQNQLLNQAYSQNARELAGGVIGQTEEAAARGLAQGSGVNQGAMNRLNLNRMMADTMASTQIPLQAAQMNAQQALEGGRLDAENRGLSIDAFGRYSDAQRNRENALTERGRLGVEQNRLGLDRWRYGNEASNDRYRTMADMLRAQTGQDSLGVDRYRAELEAYYRQLGYDQAEIDQLLRMMGN